MITSTDIFFHETTVIALYRKGNSIQLKLDGAYLNGVEVQANIEFFDVSQLLVNGFESDIIEMKQSDGEVFTLIYLNNIAELVIEWNDFDRHYSEVVSYKITANEIVIEVVD